MPETSSPKRREAWSVRREALKTRPTPHASRLTIYAELQARTNFSFLQGASHPDELVARAAELGYAALAITDHNSLAGVVRAHVATKELGLKLLIGSEITPADAGPVVLWASDRAAYGRLSRLISLGRRAAPKGECRLTFDNVAAHSAGLLAGVVLRQMTSDDLSRYREVFADRCYAVGALHRGPEDRRRLHQMVQLTMKARLPLLAANDVY